MAWLQKKPAVPARASNRCVTAGSQLLVVALRGTASQTTRHPSGNLALKYRSSRLEVAAHVCRGRLFYGYHGFFHSVIDFNSSINFPQSVLPTRVVIHFDEGRSGRLHLITEFIGHINPKEKGPRISWPG